MQWYGTMQWYNAMVSLKDSFTARRQSKKFLAKFLP